MVWKPGLFRSSWCRLRFCGACSLRGRGLPVGVTSTLARVPSETPPGSDSKPHWSARGRVGSIPPGLHGGSNPPAGSFPRHAGIGPRIRERKHGHTNTTHVPGLPSAPTHRRAQRPARPWGGRSVCPSVCQSVSQSVSRSADCDL